jgi:hypothetical protein
MARYEVEGPDGSLFEVEGPEGAQEAQIIAAVEDMIRSESATSDPSVIHPTTEAYLQAVENRKNANRTALGRGLANTARLTQEGIGSSMEGVGKILGLEGLEEYGADIAMDNEAALQRAERSAVRRQDVEGLGTGLSYFGQALGESAGPMGIGIGAGIAGAKIGAMVGGAPGALVGGLAGAIGSQIPLFYGWNRQRQIDVAGGDRGQVSEAAAFLTAIPQATMEGIVDRMLVGGMFTSKAMKGGGIFTRVAKGAGRGATIEIPTEIGQQVLERAQAGLPLLDEEAITEYTDAGVAAGLIGGTVGGAGNVRATTAEMRKEAENQRIIDEILKDDTPPVQGPPEMQGPTQPPPVQGPPEMQGPPDRPIGIEDKTQEAQQAETIDKVLEYGKQQAEAQQREAEAQQGEAEAEAARYDLPSQEVLDQYKRTLDDALKIEDAAKRQAAIDDFKKQLGPDIFEILYRATNVIPDFVDVNAHMEAERKRKRKQNEQRSEPDVEGAGGAGVQDVVPETDDTDAQESDALKETGVDGPDVGPGSVDDRESDAATALTDAEKEEIKQLRLKEKAIGLEPSEQERLNELTSIEVTPDVTKEATLTDAEQTIVDNAPDNEKEILRQVLVKQKQGVKVEDLSQKEGEIYLKNVLPTAKLTKETGEATGRKSFLDTVKEEGERIKALKEAKAAPKEVTPDDVDLDAAGDAIDARQTISRSRRANIDVVKKNFTAKLDELKAKFKTIPYTNTYTKDSRDKAIRSLNTKMLVAIADIQTGKTEKIAAEKYKKAEEFIKNIEDEAEVQAILDFRVSEMKKAGARDTERRTEKTKKGLAKEFSNTIDGKMEDLVKLYHEELRGDFENPPNVLSIRDMEVILETTQFKSRQPNVFFYKHFTMMQALYAAAYASAVEGGQIQKTGMPRADAYYAGMNKRAGNKFRTWVNNNLSDEAIKWFETTRATFVNKDATSTNDRKAVARDEAAAQRAKDWNLREGWEPYREKLPEEYVVDMDIPMRPSTISFLKNGELSSALADLAHTTPNKSIAELANRLIKYAGATKLKVVATMDSAGSFDPKTNTIRLNADSGLNTHTLLHEMAHAAVSAELDNKSSPTRNQINTLFEAVKGLTGTAYGSTNLQEFVAEVMSNPQFQETLASIYIKGERISALQRVKNIIANFFRRITGKKTVALTYIPEFDPKIIKDEATALDALDTLINGNDIYEGLLAPAPEFRNAGIMKLNSNPASTKQTLSFLEKINKMFAGKIDKAGRTRFAAESNEYLKTGTEKFTKAYLSLVGSQGVGDIAQGAGFGRLGYDADETMQRQRGAINMSDERVKKVVQLLVQWTKNNPKAKIILDDLIYNINYGSTIQQVDPTLTRKEAEEKYTRYILEYTNNKGEVKRRYFKDKRQRDIVAEKFSDPKYDSSKLNPESEKFAIWEQQQPLWNSLKQSGGQHIYNKMNTTYKQMYDELKQTINGRIDDAMGTDVETAKVLKSKVFNKIFKLGTLDVYFPLVRKGKYILSYNLKPESVPKGADPYVFEMFATELERDYAAEDLKNNPNVRQETIDIKKNEKLNIEDFQKAPPTSFVAQTLDILGKERKDKDGNTIRIGKDVKDEIITLFLNTLPETSLAKQLKKRKGTPGFIPDSLIAMSTKAYDLGRQTKRLEYGAKLKNLQTEIDKLVPPPTAKKSFEEIRKELNKRLNYARNPPSQRISKALNQGAFIYTIGFNISSALVNLSQVPLFVMPYLGARYGYPETAAAIGTMGKLVLNAKNNVVDMYDIAEDGTYTLKKDLELPDGLKEEYIKLAPVVQMAAERGLLTTSFLQDALGLDESGRERSYADRISAFSAIPFNHGERFNRQVTILSAYKLHIDQLLTKGQTQPTAAQADEAARSAIYQAQETNGGTVLETAPSISQNALGRVAFMYKPYGLQMYYTMLKSTKQALDKSNFTKEERKIAMKQLAGIHGTALFFAGVYGIPLYGAVSMIWNLFLDDEEEDFDTMVRKSIGEGFFKGVPTMAGMDVSNRIRLTGLLIQNNRYNQVRGPDDIEGFLGFHLGGPALSTGKRLFRGGMDLYNGETRRGIESLLPAGIANMFKVAPLGIGRINAEGGYKTRRGDPIHDDVSLGEKFGQFIGFAPTEYTFQQERNNILKGIDTATNKKRSELLKKYYVANTMGDWDELQDIQKDMNTFNGRHPDHTITAKTIERSMKAHRKTTQLMHHGVKFSSALEQAMKENSAQWDQGLQLFK